jgi:hypothetical protein
MPQCIFSMCILIHKSISKTGSTVTGYSYLLLIIYNSANFLLNFALQHVYINNTKWHVNVNVIISILTT